MNSLTNINVVINALKHRISMTKDFLVLRLFLVNLLQNMNGIKIYKDKIYSNSKSQKLTIDGGITSNNQGVIPQNVYFHLLSSIKISPYM
jgi:hypothetical protein